MTRHPRLAFLLGLAATLAFGWLAFPRLLYVQAEQPLQFSHRIHTAEATGLTCGDCHALRADGDFGGIPPLATCANCHAEALGSSAEERRLIEDYVRPGREIPWRVYARQPDNVHFPHAPHVVRAGLACDACHGAHGASETLVAFESDRISGYSRGLTGMGACEHCHRERGKGTLACAGCHK